MVEVRGRRRASNPGASRSGRRRGAPRTSTTGPSKPRPRDLPDHDHPHPAAAVPAYLHPPLPHLAGRPRRPARPRRSLARGGSRRATTSATPTARSATTSRRSSTRHGVDLDGGRVLMAAMPRAFGYCFNPISVFWCFGPDGDQRAVVVEVHNTYGDRHAYLVHPDEQGRARTDKQMYVSPFHGTDGHYELAVPVPGDRLDVAVTLAHRRRRAVHAPRCAARPPTYRPWRAAPAALRTAAPDPGARRLAVAAPAARPPATRPPPGRGVPPMTLSPTRTHRRPRDWPGLFELPSGPRNAIASPIARRLFRAAVSRLDVTVEIEHRPRPARGARPRRAGRCGSTAPRSSTPGSAATA